MRADLHIHSRYSDGGYWPTDIVALAKAARLEAVCVTDHDTLGAYPEFARTALAAGLSTWPSVEIDCVDSTIGYRSEILAYFPDGRYTYTEAFLASGRAERAAIIETLFERAKKTLGNKDLGFSSILALRLEGRDPRLPPLDISSLRFSKTDFYIALRQAGVVPKKTGYKDFKKAYFDTGMFSDARFVKPELGVIAEIVRSDGGVLVIPHPGHEFGDSARELNAQRARLDALLRRFKELGVGGVELYDYHNGDTAAINKIMKERCEKLGLFHTYGSDTHGPGSVKNDIGAFYGDFGGFSPRKKHGKG
jgi:3',5'-nucleoside bisphosphate phosphatase